MCRKRKTCKENKQTNWNCLNIFQSLKNEKKCTPKWQRALTLNYGNAYDYRNFFLTGAVRPGKFPAPTPFVPHPLPYCAAVSQHRCVLSMGSRLTLALSVVRCSIIPGQLLRILVYWYSYNKLSGISLLPTPITKARILRQKQTAENNATKPTQYCQ